MRDHPTENEDIGEWVHVADAASRVVLDSVSQGRDQIAASTARSGPAPNTGPKSSGNGRQSSARVVLPWMTNGLSPNDRVHWAKRAKAVQGYRFSAAMLAREAGWLGLGAVDLRVTFCPPSGWRTGDMDNLIARFKAGQDGLADTLQVNDAKLRVQHHLGERCKGGAVVVEINPQFGECIP